MCAFSGLRPIGTVSGARVLSLPFYLGLSDAVR
jgi:hypothetical protein